MSETAESIGEGASLPLRYSSIQKRLWREALDELMRSAGHGLDDFSRVREIVRLAREQTLDDKSTIGHSSGGQTATSRIGSTWVVSLPAGDTTTIADTLWPERDDEQADLAAAMDFVLSALSPSDVDLLLLRYDNRIPLREIGEIAGCSKDTVSRMLDQLRGLVRTSVELLYGEPDNYTDARAALVRFGQQLRGGGGTAVPTRGGQRHAPSVPPSYSSPPSEENDATRGS